MGKVSIQARKLVAFNVIFLAVATIAVVLRIISLRIRKRSWVTHDFLCLLSWVCLFGYTVDLNIGAIHGGIGINQLELLARKGYPEIVIALKVFFVSEFFWSTGVASFRLAILLLYIEIFRRSLFYRAAVVTAVIVAAYYVACILTVCLLCQPINFNWNKLLPNGKCGNTKAIELFSAAFNMVVDVWVVCLPLPIVWTLQMPTQKKIGVSATFALGLAIAGINLGRVIQTIQCNALDFTYCLMGSEMLVVGELSVGILVACVPTLAPVFFPDRFGSSAKAYQYKPSGASSRKAPRGPATDLEGSVDRPFQSLEDDDIEMNAALNSGSDSYRAHASRAAILENPPRTINANQIDVRRDLHIFDTPKHC